MRKNIKFLAMAAIAILSMSACSNDIEEQIPEKGKTQPVQFQMTLSGTNTRTTTSTAPNRTTTWSEGDAVGIFVYKAGETTNPVKVNMKYVLTGDTWAAADAGNEIYPEESYDYYAYYPYQSGITDPANISVAALQDQTKADETDYAKSDILAAGKINADVSASTVKLVFAHMFAMVEVKVDGDLVTQKPAKVELKGIKLASKLNILGATPTATIDASASAVDVNMFYLTKTANATQAPFSYRAVVPEQTIAKGTPLIAISDIDGTKKTYTMQYSTDVPYEAGKFRQVNVNIGTAKVSITMQKTDFTIDSWGTSTEVTGNGTEVVALVTSVTPEITADMPFTDKNIFNTDKVTDTKTYWFHRENTAPVTTVSVAASEGPAIALAIGATKGSWNNSCVGYHFYGKLERTTYKVTLSMKSNITNGIAGITVSGSKDDKMFEMLNDKGADWTRNVTTYNSLADAWVTKSFYIDTTQASTDGKSSNLTAYTGTTDEDVDKGINIMLYNYSGEASTVYIKDITIAKSALPVQ